MPPERAPASALRYGAFYGALLLLLGIYMPFWPVFLKSRGLDAAEIGLLFALLSWTKVVSTPAIAQVADRSGRVKTILALAACGSFVSFVAFHNQRGTAEQHIKEGENAINWTRLSCHGFRNKEVRLQLHALAYNLGNFLRTLALPDEVEHWSLTTLREKWIKIGARVVKYSRYVTFQLAEVATPRTLFAEILRLIDGLRPASLPP